MQQEPLPYAGTVCVSVKRRDGDAVTYAIDVAGDGGWQRTAVVITGVEPTMVEMRELGRIVMIGCGS